MKLRFAAAATLALLSFSAATEHPAAAQGRRSLYRTAGPARFSASSPYWQSDESNGVYYDPPRDTPAEGYYLPSGSYPAEGQYVGEPYFVGQSEPYEQGQAEPYFVGESAPYDDGAYVEGELLPTPFADDPVSEDLPPGEYDDEGYVYPDGYAPDGFGEGYYPDGYYPDGYYPDGYYPDGIGYDGGYCDQCDSYGSDCTCWYLGGVDLDVLGLICPRGRYYVTADYLYVRANLSESIAYLVQDDSAAPTFVDEFHELPFRHDSSYRVGGGYYMENCDDQLRFLFTRMTSYAEAFVEDDDGTIIGPFETSPGAGGTLDIHGQVTARSWDLEYAKTIWQLGQSPADCGCIDSCGCHSGYDCDCGGCGNVCCPTWAITWSGGLRFSDVDWARAYVSNNPTAGETRAALTTLDFEGGGPRVGLEGRRFFGRDNWGSAYVRGDISLLLGHVDLFEQRIVSDGSPPDNVNLQSANFRNLIPVTEIEAGLSAQLTDRTSFSTGYLFSAWHDLGFRDQFQFATFLATLYDDANILGFDGFFARLEWMY